MNPYKKEDPSHDTHKCTWKLAENQQNPHITEVFCPIPPKISDTILDNVGRTPMVRINKIAQSEGVECEMLVKCEFLNPFGSVKDRIGRRMLLDAEKSGRIKPGDILIEATSGNTGIGLATAAAIKNYQMIITLPEKMSTEKTDVLQALGAKIYRTPTECSFDDPSKYLILNTKDSHLSLAFKMQAELANSHVLDQYCNPSNPMAHYDTLAEEILYQTDNKVDAIFVGAGTGGTIMGIARKLKEKLPSCKIVGINPFGSVLAMPKDRPFEEVSYLVEGIGYDFIPKTIDRYHMFIQLSRTVVDDWMHIDDHESFNFARRLIKEEGLFVGGSSGGCISAAIRYCKENEVGKDKRVVCILPDNLRNYITKFLSKEWMVAKGFYDQKELFVEAPIHPFRDVPISKLGLKNIQTYGETLTVGEGRQLFSNGAPVIVLTKDNQLLGLILIEKLMNGIVNKGLKDTDLIKSVWTKDFIKADVDKIDCAVLEKFIQRNKIVILYQLNEKKEVSQVFVAQPQDLLCLIKN